ncbi:MAG: hypothetical protein CVV59_01580 [Tenericutes bacterium HGW-Tenericutes-4]|nr:MAG: hypothetical protein CVV59_01580 [Tenericutes bacterium HGW-Tenericutes-4]
MRAKCPYCGAYVEPERRSCRNCKTALPFIVKRPVIDVKELVEEETELDKLKRLEQEEQDEIEQTKKMLRLIYIGAAILFIIFFVIILFTHISFTSQFGY